jgi:hypothetical protein
MSKFSVYPDQPGRWQPTPPSYMDGIDHWGEIRTLVLIRLQVFKTRICFSLDKKSPFYKEVQEVYDISLKMKKMGDGCEEVKMAQFWDCNPCFS